jgi:hypothetical protein
MKNKKQHLITSFSMPLPVWKKAKAKAKKANRSLSGHIRSLILEDLET